MIAHNFKGNIWGKAKLIWSGLFVSNLSPLHRLTTQHFVEHYKHKQNKSFFEPARTHHLGLKAQNLENPIFAFGCFSLKAVYDSCKLQRRLQVAKFLFMNSFTHINIVFLFRHPPTEIVVLITVFYQIKCSNKVFKDIKIFWTVYSRPFIRHQGKNLHLF